MAPTAFSVLLGMSFLVHEIQYYSQEGVANFTDDIAPAFGLHLPVASRVAAHAVFIASAVAFALFPHLWAVWALLTGSLILLTLTYSRRMFSHLTVGLLMLFAIGARWGSWSTDGLAVRGLLQALTLLTLFLAGFHKLNRGFLNPRISYGVYMPVLYLRQKGLLSESRGLPHWARVASPLAVIVMEMGLPLTLVWPASATAGFVVFALLMVFFALVGPQDFAMTMLAGVCVFLDPATVIDRFPWGLLIAAPLLGFLLSNRLRGRVVWIEVGSTALIVGATLYLLGQLALGASIRPVLPAAFSGNALPAALVLALFVFNWACPFFGIKFDGSLAMFSNLRPDRWNHVVIRRRWQLAVPRYVTVVQLKGPGDGRYREWIAYRFPDVQTSQYMIGYVSECLTELNRRFPNAPLAIDARDCESGERLTLRGVKGECRRHERLCLYPTKLPRQESLASGPKAAKRR